MDINFGITTFSARIERLPSFNSRFAQQAHTELRDDGIPKNNSMMSPAILHLGMTWKRCPEFLSRSGQARICAKHFRADKRFQILHSLGRVLRPAIMIDFCASGGRYITTKFSLIVFQLRKQKRSPAKWFPYSKGGEFRRWYGNDDLLVNWEKDGQEIRNFFDESGKSFAAGRKTLTTILGRL